MFFVLRGISLPWLSFGSGEEVTLFLLLFHSLVYMPFNIHFSLSLCFILFSLIQFQVSKYFFLPLSMLLLDVLCRIWCGINPSTVQWGLHQEFSFLYWISSSCRCICIEWKWVNRLLSLKKYITGFAALGYFILKSIFVPSTSQWL